MSFQSVSAFAPILHLSASHWGKFALPQYLGNDESTWKEYDVVELLKKYVAENNFRKDVKVLIDQVNTKEGRRRERREEGLDRWTEREYMETGLILGATD